MPKKKKKSKNLIWGSRFKSLPSEIAVKYTSSVNIDNRLYKQDIEASKRYAFSLKEAKAISVTDYQKINKGLNKILKEIKSDKFTWSDELEDVHMNIEHSLSKKIGGVAKKLHTGRSRNDQVATDLRLFLINAIENINNKITKTQIAIVRKAEKYYDSLMPGFTHMQIAQPITFGHHLMAWFEMLERDMSRMEETKDRMSTLPLGSGALSGSRYKIDLKKLAKELNFERISNNSVDAVSDRDFVIEFLSSISILGIHLSRFNEEIVLWSSPQFNYIKLGEQFFTGSSIMPQKKNPDVAELIRGGTARYIGNLSGILSLLKNLPLSYNRDMQEDKRFVFDSLDHCLKSLEIFSSLVDSIVANTKKMREDCNLGQITATELADYLVTKNIPFRRAHNIVAKIVSYAEKENRQIFELSLKELKKKSKSIEDDVKNYLSPESAVKAKSSIGGTAPNQVSFQIKRAKKLLKSRKGNG